MVEIDGGLGKGDIVVVVRGRGVEGDCGGGVMFAEEGEGGEDGVGGGGIGVVPSDNCEVVGGGPDGG